MARSVPRTINPTEELFARPLAIDVVDYQRTVYCYASQSLNFGQPIGHGVDSSKCGLQGGNQ
jgi:hypothetical protein